MQIVCLAKARLTLQWAQQMTHFACSKQITGSFATLEGALWCIIGTCTCLEHAQVGHLALARSTLHGAQQTRWTVPPTEREICTDSRLCCTEQQAHGPPSSASIQTAQSLSHVPGQKWGKACSRKSSRSAHRPTPSTPFSDPVQIQGGHGGTQTCLGHPLPRWLCPSHCWWH